MRDEQEALAAAGAGPMPRKPHLDALAITLLVGCCLVWGFQQVLAKATIAEVPPIFQVAVRLGGATILLWLWCRLRGIALFTADGSLGAGLLAGALFTSEFALAFSAFAYSGASRVTLLLYTSPFWVAALLPFFIRSEHMRLPQWAGLLLAFLAVMFVLREGATAPGGLATPLQWRGDLMALLGGMAWGFTTIVIRSSRLTRVSAEKLLFYQVGVGAVCLPLLSLALGEPWTWHWSVFASVSLALQTVVGAFASYLVWMWLLGRYPATRISVFVFLTPVFAMLFGAWWLGEVIGINLVIGVALVAVGIVLVSREAATTAVVKTPHLG